MYNKCSEPCLIPTSSPHFQHLNLQQLEYITILPTTCQYKKARFRPEMKLKCTTLIVNHVESDNYILGTCENLQFIKGDKPYDCTFIPRFYEGYEPIA